MLKIRGKQAFIVFSIFRCGWRSNARFGIQWLFAVNRAEVVALIKRIQIQCLVALRATIYMPDSACCEVQSSYRRRSDSMDWYSVSDPEIYTGASEFSVSGSWACMHFTRTEVRCGTCTEKPFALSCAL